MKPKQVISVLIFAFVFAMIPLISNAQYLNISINDQGSSPSVGEQYYLQIMYVEENDNGNISYISITSGAYQSFSSSTYYPNGTITPVYFSADVPDDIYSKNYRVYIRMCRDTNPPSIPYIVEGDGWSASLNSDDFYSASGIDIDVTLN